jgi:hypothetical protein
MLEFKDPFKIYLFKHSQEVKLSIRINNRVVDTYKLDQMAFEQLLSACQDGNGAEVRSNGISWWAQHKHRGRSTDYVRLSAWYAGASREYRTDRYIIDNLCAEYLRQKQNPMPWDQSAENSDE